MTTYETIIRLINTEVSELSEEIRADRDRLIDAFVASIAEDLKSMKSEVSPTMKVELTRLEADMVVQVLLREIDSGRDFFQPVVDRIRTEFNRSGEGRIQFMYQKDCHDLSQFI